ncbi:MAG: hypothetical protein AB8G77_12540 [Rhodothermales bacterium]
MTNRFLKIIPIVFVGILSAGVGYVFANNSGSHSAHHSDQNDVSAFPTEQGQSSFAAIAEIVTILENNPNTDWSKVNINALREHLVDMDALTLGANASMEIDENSITFIATGTGPSLRALQNMVPAHANELDKMNEWSAIGEKTEKGAVLKITPQDTSQLARIKALGFFGLMATGGHHQPHHLGMASGTMVH